MTGKTIVALRAIGSLWLTVVLLVLMMVAMGSATVFESMFGTERALETFYFSAWFKLLLALLGVNALAAVLSRFPILRSKIGFLLTHAGILVILAGALITELYGVHGEMTIAEGQTVTHFNVERAMLQIAKGDDDPGETIDLPEELWGGFEAVSRPSVEPIPLGAHGQVRIARYVPDMFLQQVVLDDNPDPSYAIELQFVSSDQAESVWLFAGQSSSVGGREAVFRLVNDERELQRLIPDLLEQGENPLGTTTVRLDGESYELKVSDCEAQAVPIGETGLSLRVIQYLPQAVLGRDGKMVTASELAINPAIEVELSGPQETRTIVLYARHPEFNSEQQLEDGRSLQLTYEAPAIDTPSVPIEFLQDPEGRLYVRIQWAGAKLITSLVEPGREIEVPWPDETLLVRQRFDHARVEQRVVEPAVVRKNRRPALLMEVSRGDSIEELWLQKYRPQKVSVAGESYRLAYVDGVSPLGFSVRLDRFRIGTYPGGERPRSYESRVTIRGTGVPEEARLISMNNPASFGGYTFYQSSYRSFGDLLASVLRVSKDPGMPIVFAGYIVTLVGMLVVLMTRVREKRRSAALPNP